MTTWYTVSRLSDHQEMTPEGFLLVRDVPVARIGTQLYRHNELPDLEPNGDGWLSVDREPDEVFHADSVASFTGKPITNDHPSDIVGPGNWSKLAIGVVQHPRRGSGANSDVLVADLLFTTQRGIDLVKRGKRELSVGYDASYEQKAPGMARQRNIIANHVALVDQGRCGKRCTIIDGKPKLQDGVEPMPTKLRRKMVRNLVTLWYDGRPIYTVRDKEFVESEHPREPDGKFGSGGGGGASSSAPTPTAKSGHLPTKVVNGKRVDASGGALPEHVQKLKIPPAWTDVTYHPDPSAPLQATGRDAKGRRQSIYSEEHHAKQAAAKFERVAQMNAQFNTIYAQNEKNRKAGNQAADALALIMHTGMRPGGEADTGASEESYGATNLEGRHVVETKDGMKLQFVPGKKKGKTIEMRIDDPGVADMLRKRKAAAGDNGRLFPVTSKQLLKYAHELGDFKVKDYRTQVGTQTALKAIAKLPTPKNPVQYKSAVTRVAKTVSEKLGNTPKIALASYISPVVFSEWQQKAGVGTKDQAPDDDEADGDIELPDARWGSADAERPPMEKPDEDEMGDDGEDITEADPDVIAMLGFDPFDIDDDDASDDDAEDID